MGKRKTNYFSDWEKQYTWITSVKKDASLAFGKLCDNSFRIAGSGISQVTLHARGQLHLQREKASQNQSMIWLNPSSVSTITEPEVVFWSKESIIKAEIFQAPETVDSNLSFASANDNGKLFREMFPHSDIVQRYKQSKTKTKYSIQIGLAPYSMQSLQDDFLSREFPFKIDKTATSPVRKQYNTIQYWSNSMKCIIVLWITFCWLFLFWNFDKAFFWVYKNTNLDINYMLHTAIDCPNVNLKF